MNKAVKNPRLHGAYILVEKDRQFEKKKKKTLKNRHLETSLPIHC